jgi:hypothetical protein
MSTTTKELVEYGRFLRNAAPREFEAFYIAFEKYTELTIYNLVNATGDLTLSQGHAQQSIKILRVLEEIKNG